MQWGTDWNPLNYFLEQKKALEKWRHMRKWLEEECGRAQKKVEFVIKIYDIHYIHYKWNWEETKNLHFTVHNKDFYGSQMPTRTEMQAQEIRKGKMKLTHLINLM